MEAALAEAKSGRDSDEDHHRVKPTPVSRLNTKDMLAAFCGMGDTTAELQKTRMRLMVDGSYFESWTDPSWLMPECALGDSRVTTA